MLTEPITHLGGLLGLLGVPDGLHLGHVGTVLVLGDLVLLPPLVPPPDTNQQSRPPAGLRKKRENIRGQPLSLWLISP